VFPALDAEAIRNLKACYAALCGSDYDADGIAMLFTKDALWESPGLGRFEGREAIRNFFRGPRLKRSRQNALRSRQRIQNREVVSAVDRQQVSRKTPLCPPPAILDRLTAQFRQFPGAIGHDQLAGLRRQMPDRAVAFGLGRIETQLLVEVIEPNRLQIENAADRHPAAHLG
jgi:hypothetical protein